MDTLLFVARLLLAGTFALAGATKLLDLPGSRRTLRDFGAPAGLAGPLGVMLPVAELLVAIALFPSSSAFYGAVGALVLLSGFVAAITVNLVRGRRPDCHCFGQVHSSPIGASVLLRNALLAGIAVFVVVTGSRNPGPSGVAWLMVLSPAERSVVLGGTVGLALLAWQVVQLRILIAQNQRLLSQLSVAPASAASVASPAPSALSADASQAPLPLVIPPREAGHPPGTPAPAFDLPSLAGETVSLDALRAAGKPTVLIFSDPDCGPCTAMLPDIGRWQRDQAGALTIAVLSRGTTEDNRAKTSDLNLSGVLLQRDREVMTAYGAIGTPSAVVVRPDGTIAERLAQAEAEIRQLIARWTPGVESSRPKPLDPAPGFTLTDLNDERVALAQFKGRPTLVLFWNPLCVHCNRMLSDLKEWEKRPLAERAQLLVVATGSADDNRAQGLQSTVLLDPQFTVGALYGVEGTPSAVLIDAEARLAGPLVVGSTDVLALAGQPETSRDEAGVPMERTLMGVRPALPTTMPPNARPLKQDCVQDELLPDGSIVLYNGCQRQVVTLNATAALVWEYCDGEHDVDAIIAEVREVFPSSADADRDVRELLDTLLRGQMVAPAQLTPAAVAT